MTSEDLDSIDRALAELLLSPHDGYPAGARGAALGFNAQIERERSRVEAARRMRAEAGAVAPGLDVELRAAAVMLVAERERVVRRWSIPLRPRAA